MKHKFCRIIYESITTTADKKQYTYSEKKVGYRLVNGKILVSMTSLNNWLKIAHKYTNLTD